MMMAAPFQMSTSRPRQSINAKWYTGTAAMNITTRAVMNVAICNPFLSFTLQLYFIILLEFVNYFFENFFIFFEDNAAVYFFLNTHPSWTCPAFGSTVSPFLWFNNSIKPLRLQGLFWKKFKFFCAGRGGLAPAPRGNAYAMV